MQTKQLNKCLYHVSNWGRGWHHNIDLLPPPPSLSYHGYLSIYKMQKEKVRQFPIISYTGLKQWKMPGTVVLLNDTRPSLRLGSIKIERVMMRTKQRTNFLYHVCNWGRGGRRKIDLSIPPVNSLLTVQRWWFYCGSLLPVLVPEVWRGFTLCFFITPKLGLGCWVTTFRELSPNWVSH